jgi:hypothetical protein
LKGLRDDIYDLNQQQNAKLNDRGLAVIENNGLFTEVRNIILDVMEVGKALYTGVNSEKVKEYTMVRMLNRIRQQTNPVAQEKADESELCAVYITCKDDHGQALEGLLIRNPENNQTVETDEEGVGYFEALPTKESCKVTFIIEGIDVVTQTITDKELVPGGDLEFDVDMESATTTDDTGTDVTPSS